MVAITPTGATDTISTLTGDTIITTEDMHTLTTTPTGATTVTMRTRTGVDTTTATTPTGATTTPAGLTGVVPTTTPTGVGVTTAGPTGVLMLHTGATTVTTPTLTGVDTTNHPLLTVLLMEMSMRTVNLTFLTSFSLS